MIIECHFIYYGGKYLHCEVVENLIIVLVLDLIFLFTSCFESCAFSVLTALIIGLTGVIPW